MASTEQVLDLVRAHYGRNEKAVVEKVLRIVLFGGEA